MGARAVGALNGSIHAREPAAAHRPSTDEVRVGGTLQLCPPGGLHIRRRRLPLTVRRSERASMTSMGAAAQLDSPIPVWRVALTRDPQHPLGLGLNGRSGFAQGQRWRAGEQRKSDECTDAVAAEAPFCVNASY